LRRITGRRNCPVCQTIYNVYLHPPKVEGVCDIEGATLVQRSDDTETCFAGRLTTYQSQTAPVVEHYRALSRFAEVNGDQPVEQVAAGIISSVERLRAGKSGNAVRHVCALETVLGSGIVAVILKSTREVEHMRRAGRVVREVLNHVREQVRPGATTLDLENAAEAKLKELGAKAAFKGYHGYPCVLCTSVNSEVVHGIPSKKRVLKEGDIVSVDCGAIVDGFYGDAAITVAGGR
jgi:Xaa-Pro aminopeptidase